jgi:hypothetical protein
MSLASQPMSSSQQEPPGGSAEGQAAVRGSPGPGSLACSRDMDVDVLSLALTS